MRVYDAYDHIGACGPCNKLEINQWNKSADGTQSK